MESPKTAGYNRGKSQRGPRSWLRREWLLLAAAGLVGMGAWDGWGAGKTSRAESPWERGMVKLEITRKQYDPTQPWNTRPENHTKNGVVIDGNSVLTTAEYLADASLLRIQKGGRGKWWDGKISWIDYHANLALIEAKDPMFFDGTLSAAFADTTPAQGELEVVRWRDGQFDARKADVNRVHILRSKLSFVEHLQLEMSSEIKAAGWSEAVVAGRKLVGLMSSQEGNTASVIPATFIKAILEARKKGTFRGLGYFDFVWQRTENPVVHQQLGLAGEPRGVVVIQVPYVPGRQSPLRPHDLLLKIDGFDIDIRGDYRDPVHGNLMLEGLAVRNHWAGDKIRIQVWRKGALVDLDYEIPRADFTKSLVPQSAFDTPPEYLIVAGLVFQPLNEPFLRSWGSDWRRRVPFRLGYYTREEQTPERPAVLILSSVLPDSSNLGYSDYRYLAVLQVNGRRVSRIAELAEALKQPRGGFHVIEFERGDSFSRLVLDAAQSDSATSRVLLRYGIEEASRLNTN